MKETKKNFKKLWKYLRTEKKRMSFIIILSIIQIVVRVAIPLIDAQIIIKLTNNLIDQLVLFSITYILIVAFGDTLEYIVEKLYVRLHKNVSLEIIKELSREILKLNNKTLDDNGSGFFVQRIMGDANNLSSVFEGITLYTRDILTNIGVIVSIYLISKVIFLYVLIIIVVRFIIESRRLKLKKINRKEVKEISDKAAGFAGEMVRGSRDIKMLNSEESFLQNFYSKFKFLNDKAIKTNNTNLNYLFIRWLWSEFSHFGLLILIAILVSGGNLEISLAIIVLNFSGRWNSLANNIIGVFDLTNDFDVSATRLFDVIDGDKYQKEKFGLTHIDNVNGDFEFNNVSFKYEDKKVLDKLSFKVNANETVAFVGKSGVGKTTIFNLLCKMYDGYSGKITIDGNDIKTLDKDSIRGNITIVSQDPYIFNVSIKENLQLVCDDLTDKQMKEACKMACLDEFIESLPDKYDTIVGEGGVNLSGGQKQRLAIARAFVQKTEIILFDEATSALDNKTQAQISKAIENLKKDYTILIVAHRLSTIKNADRILFIEDGKILAEGTHNSLLKNCKPYKELYEVEIEK